MFLGANIFARYMIDDRISIEHNAGYAYNIGKRYSLAESSMLAMGNHGHRPELFVGLIYRRNNDYTKLK
ncbi:hypothetical protein LS73_001435 [Helicobacter muridarum]|uniref:Uncharacterized protein n=2 Tax=Helicobacter muridarum TaxID=216 RepID=A0A4U8TLL3_9HELI|nr:hypothetical protein [Helicobacter muridarum]TLE01372.1 hypothetical protein LS73_001435 [Helicobacter muridarum]